MVKNIIISGLLMYILSEKDGWAVAGLEKVLTCVCLTVLLALLISLLEKAIREVVKEYV